MEKPKKQPPKRTQRDYSMAFKLTVVSEVEKGLLTYKQAQKKYGIQGRSTVLTWLRKHGEKNWSITKKHSYITKMKETPAQKIKRLERELADEKLKNKVLTGVIDYADEHLGTSIRKKSYTHTSENSNKNKK